MSNRVIIKANTPLGDDVLYAARTARLEIVPVGESRWEIEMEHPDNGCFISSEPYSEKSEAEEDARKVQKIFPGADVTVGLQYAQHKGLAEDLTQEGLAEVFRSRINEKNPLVGEPEWIRRMQYILDYAGAADVARQFLETISMTKTTVRLKKG